jgi:hypothetical protein
MKNSRFHVLLLTGLFGLATTAGAQDGEQIRQLQQQVRDLETRLQALESRFDEGVPVNRALPVTPKPGGWRNAVNWTYLTKGMTKDEVVRFLGEPEKRKSVKKFEFWDYGDGKTALYLNRLKSWDVPSQAGDQ